MRKLKIELGRQGNFIVAILLIYFVFFGYIAYVYEKSIGIDIIFLYKVLFNPASYLSTIILILIVFFIVFRETFFEYGVRNSIMLTPIIIGISWFWSQFINGFNLAIIPYFFIRIEGYLTIITILGINFLSAILAAIIKELYKEYLMKSQEIENIWILYDKIFIIFF